MNDKPHSHGYLKRKTRAPPRCYINGKLGMTPIFELVGAHEKSAAVNVAQVNVISTHFKFALFKTHRLRAVAASAALVKHQFAKPTA